MMSFDDNEDQYMELLQELYNDAEFKGDRTGTGTYSKFGHQMRFKLNDGGTFPLLTTKKVHWKSVVHELLWFIKGDTNIKYLQDNGVRIWDEWADEKGDLGPVYGKQWRDFGGGKLTSLGQYQKGVDQLQDVIERIKTNPHDRRLIVSAWDPAVVDQMALPPCHCLFQFYSNNNKLSLQLYQRSCDVFLGVPFNIASYALLLMMVAHVTGQEADEFIWTGGDTHLYTNHLAQAREQLLRDPKDAPSVMFKRGKEITNIEDFKFEDIELHDYKPYPVIKGKVSV